MSRFHLDDDTADRLIEGRLDPQDAPPDFRSVAALLSAAARPSQTLEGAALPVSASALAEAVRGSTARHGSRRHQPMSHLLSTKLAALVTGVVLSAGAVAAAATGNLPGPAQSAVSIAFSHVGVDVPNGHSNGHANANAAANANGHRHGEGNAHNSTDSTDSTETTDSTDSRDFGLCKAWLARPNSHAGDHPNAASQGRNPDATAFKDLIAAHGGTSETLTTYCKGVVATAGHGESTNTTEAHGSEGADHPGTTGVSGETPSTGANSGSNGPSRAGSHRD